MNLLVVAATMDEARKTAGKPGGFELEQAGEHESKSHPHLYASIQTPSLRDVSPSERKPRNTLRYANASVSNSLSRAQGRTPSRRRATDDHHQLSTSSRPGVPQRHTTLSRGSILGIQSEFSVGAVIKKTKKTLNTMGCRQSKADAVVGSTAAPTQREARGSLRDDLTSDLIQHKYVDDINEYFDFSSTIGTGHFGCVKHAVSKKSGKEWAVKVVALSNEVDRDALRNEINILKRLHHPQIVRVIASYEDKEHMYMIMQLCKGKELYEHLYQDHRKFSENDVRKIIRALLRALAFLHSNFITHRDLKLENLLLENAENPGSLRLCDFGLSTRFKRGEKLEKSLGTIDYVAPEVLDGDYNEKCDLWSVGVICFELLTGVSPFHAATIDETMGNIYDGVLIFENDVWSKFSPASIIFIKSLVKENVNQRLSAEQALDHKWLNEGEMANGDGSSSARLQSDKRMLLTNMLSFSQCRKMKQTALLSVALGISEDHIQQEMAAEVFHSMDRNKTGSLSRDEFCSALVECGVSNADAVELFKRINQSKSGRINYLEFMAAVMDQRDIGQSTIKEAFGILDGEKQGRLSIVGLQDVFKNSMVAEEVKEMIASVDTKGDGFVDFEAFQGLFAPSGTPLPQVVEEDSSTTVSIENVENDSLEKPMVIPQRVSHTHTESTVDSTTDRATSSSTPNSDTSSSGKVVDAETIKADLVRQNDVTVSMIDA